VSWKGTISRRSSASRTSAKRSNSPTEQGHHPDIYLAWGKVRLTVWTHKIDGLTESDFVFAAKSDRVI
jgi:pterin-4a-carbinolamine dehydratase